MTRRSPTSMIFDGFIGLKKLAAAPVAEAGVMKLYADSSGRLQLVDAAGSEGVTGAPGILTLAYAASVALDFDPTLAPVRRIVVTGDIILTSANLGADGRSLSVLLDGTGLAVPAAVTVPAGWRWVSTHVEQVAAGGLVLLSAQSFTALDTGVVVAGAAEVA